MSIHRNILKQAWKISLKKKYLWFFGLFSAFFCSASSFEIISNLFFGKSEFSNFQNFTQIGIFKLSYYNNLIKLFLEKPFQVTFILFIFLLIFALSIFIIWLSVVSQSAIIKNVSAIKTEKEEGFQIGLKTGIKHFWPIFSLNALMKVITFLCFILLSWDVIIHSTERDLWANLIYAIFFVICTAFLIIFSFIINYAINFIIIKNEKLSKSIPDAILLFKKNWLITLEMGFLLYIINFIIAILAFFLILLTVMPLLLFAFILANTYSTIFFTFIVGLAFVLFFLIAFFFVAFLSVYQISANTLLFIKLINNGGISKMVRIFGKN